MSQSFCKSQNLIYYFIQHVFIENPLSARNCLGVLRIQKLKHRQVLDITKCTASEGKNGYILASEGQRCG